MYKDRSTIKFGTIINDIQTKEYVQIDEMFENDVYCKVQSIPKNEEFQEPVNEVSTRRTISFTKRIR